MNIFSIFASLLATITAVSAQEGCASSASSLVPYCAQSCLLSAKSSIGCTVEIDYACACSSSAALQTNQALTQCVLSACNNNIQTALQASSGAQQICSCVATASPDSAGPTTSATVSAASTSTGSSTVDSTPAMSRSASAPAVITSTSNHSSGSTAQTSSSGSFTAPPPPASPSACPSFVNTTSIITSTIATVPSPSSGSDHDSIKLCYNIHLLTPIDTPYTLSTITGTPPSGTGGASPPDVNASACPDKVTMMLTTIVTAATGGATGGAGSSGGGSNSEGCSELSGVDYLVCCAAKVFTLGN